MSPELVTTAPPLQTTGRLLPPVPWRDPHSVSPEEIRGCIERLETACLQHPQSADLRTCLGMAYAVNYDIYKSIDALEAARVLDPAHFWSQLKYAELQYRLRALRVAETETLKALELAQNAWQISLAREQLHQIRTLLGTSTRDVTWDKPLTIPVLVLSAMIAVTFAVMLWR